MFENLSQAVPTADVKPAIVLPIFSHQEGMAITIGIKDGEIARKRSKLGRFFVFYAKEKPVQIGTRRLESLRAYAELARALFPRTVSTLSLEDAGFNGLQCQTLVGMIRLEAEV